MDLTVCMESDVDTRMGVGTAWKNVQDEVFCNQSFIKYTHTVEVQSDQTELNTMAVRPVPSKQFRDFNLLGKTKIGNRKQISKNNSYTHKKIKQSLHYSINI